MLRKITFSNFYSFEKEQTISFLAKKKETYDYYLSKSGDFITKVAGFIGGNASGKTNVMRIISFLNYFVCESSKDNMFVQTDMGFRTFFAQNKPSNFKIEFEIRDKIFVHEFEVENHKINYEKLTKKSIGKSSKTTTIFKRVNAEIKLSKVEFSGFKTTFIKNIRPDVSLIAFLKSHYNVPIVNEIYDFFASFRTNINERGEINNPIHQIKTLEMYMNDPELKEKVEGFISNFDLGLSGFDIKKEKKVDILGNTTNLISIDGIHKILSREEKLPMNYESRGTQSLFTTLPNIMYALKNSSIVIIDEIEAGLHPEALSKLISYFVEENKDGKAQMFFSSHSLGFMNKFDMHQIYLTEKNSKGQSAVYRLNEVENIRSDENFMNKYMAGAYGGFPKINV